MHTVRRGAPCLLTVPWPWQARVQWQVPCVPFHGGGTSSSCLTTPAETTSMIRRSCFFSKKNFACLFHCNGELVLSTNTIRLKPTDHKDAEFPWRRPQSTSPSSLWTYQPSLSTMVQYFSLTANQRTVLFNLAYLRSEQGSQNAIKSETPLDNQHGMGH